MRTHHAAEHEERLFHNKDCLLHEVTIGYMVYLKKSIGRNKIQDAWEPAMFIVKEVPNTDGRPYTVSRAIATGQSKKVIRREMQQCSVNNNQPIHVLMN